MPELLKAKNDFRISWAGKLMYYLLPANLLKVRRNINLVFQKTLTEQEKKRLIMAFYSHIVTSIKEIFLLLLMSRKRLLKRIEFRGIEHLVAAVAEERGAILLTGHLGNWEFAPLIGLPDTEGFDGKFYFIRKLKSSTSILFKKLIHYNFSRSGLHIIEKNHALFKVCSALRKKNAVFFVMDERASRRSSVSIKGTFLGVETAIYSSIATIVAKFKTPVVPVCTYRLKNHKHIIEFYPQVTWEEYPDRREAIYKNTLLYNEILERMILSHPEQWLWSYNRWP
ncbi:lysophospholipid acyltransferase family protein [Legionella shakespearei]|uniref:Lipid A biosynthesis acyltransferase n=1 Tax=Legionella shakespearei DSM 23087 TaxID=1122169 RepID=A0A0W0Z5X8_9GAMM|nr:lysophospholipid acyltransferase family protein [Legionella shakespearei]KTD64195.1 lipid A biosynthesis acyltransferase [Legionella shakespearei DSM 23087]